MRDHPMPSSWNRFLSGDASAAELRIVVKHLLQGCRRCLSVLAPMAPLLRLSEVEPAEEELSGDRYDHAIQSAIDAVRLHGADAPKIKAATRKVHQRLVEKGLSSVSVQRYPAYAVFNALLQRAHELRNEDPQKMLAHASFAVHTARHMTEYPDADQADLHVRALTECANAWRVNGEYQRAGQNLDLAEQWYAASTQDPLLGLRLKDIRASLYGDQQHYGAAIELLEEVYQGRLEHGNQCGAKRALVGKGIFTAYAGRLEEAFNLFDLALNLIDPEQDSELRVMTLHNKILFMADDGRFKDALNLLNERREEMVLAGGRILRLKLLGVEGRLYGALGQFDLAEHALRDTKQGLGEAGLHGHAGLIALDLATVVLRQGKDRRPEAVTLALEGLKALSELQIQPQVEEALRVLMDAIQQDLVTAPLLQSVTDFMRLAHRDRRARYQPRFE